MAGWLNECVDGLSNTKSLDLIKLECVQPVRMWRTVVAAKKKELMSKRMQNLPTNVANLRAKNKDPNVVKVVGKKYIDQMFKRCD